MGYNETDVDPFEDRSGLSEVGRFDNIWLYLSGGGLRSAIGSLGAVHFLQDPQSVHESARGAHGWGHPESAWHRVSRVSSVSGGSVENAALLKSGGCVDAHLRHTFRQFTKPARPWHPKWWWHYKWSLLTLVSSATLVWVFFWFVWTSPMWLWGFGEIVRGAVFFLVALAAFQGLATVYVFERMRVVLSAPSCTVPSGKLHIFATADMKSGLPAHIIVADDGEQRQMVVAHDRAAVVDAVDYYTVTDQEIDAEMATFASSAWPFVTFPIGRTLRQLGTGDQPLYGVVRSPDAPEQQEEQTFAMMDGGLTGTLASRLDSVLQRTADRDVMRAIQWAPDRAATDAAIAAAEAAADDDRDGALSPPTGILRVVVDGGQYLGATGLWWVSLIPGFSAFSTTQRAIKVSLDNQITVARRLADDRAAIWYVGVTGHGRHFTVRSRRHGEDLVDVIHRPVGDKATSRRRPELTPEVTTRGANFSDEDVKALHLLEHLKRDADRVKYFRVRKHAMACAASGAASAFVEAQGIGGNLDQLLGVIDRLELRLLQRGRLDDIRARVEVNRSGEVDRPGGEYRWGELEDLHDRRGTDRPFPISHRGSTAAGADGARVHDNTHAAFHDAVRRGFRVLECDVKLTRDRKLVALHGFLGLPLLRKRGSLRVWPIRRLTFARVADYLGYEPDEIGKLRSDPAFQDVTWNFEAKGTRAMTALLDEVGPSIGQPGAPIVSGGWRAAPIRTARERYPEALTAASFGEVVRLTFGRHAPHVAVVQLDHRARLLLRLAARGARKRRIQVHWYGVNSKRAIERIRDGKHPGVGINTDEHDLLQSVLGDRR